MSEEYTLYTLTDSDYLPFGTHNNDGIVFPSILVDGILYTCQAPPCVGESGNVERWIAPDNIKKLPDYEAASQALLDIKRELGGETIASVDRNYNVADLHQVLIALPEEIYETKTIGELKQLGIFDTINATVGYIAEDASQFVTEEEFQALVQDR